MHTVRYRLSREEVLPADGARVIAIEWCPRQESNLHLSLRRAPFYPLNYKDKAPWRKSHGAAILSVLPKAFNHLDTMRRLDAR